ncbi:hypothetical protein SprV_0100163200 [Sparganum proliferum]
MANSRKDITVEKWLGWALVVLSQEVAALSQCQLPHYDAGAEETGRFQDLPVWDLVLPPQLQYSSEKAEVEAIEISNWIGADSPCLRPV